MSKDGMSKDSCYAHNTESGCNLTPLVYLSLVLLSKPFYSLFLTVVYFSHKSLKWLFTI